MVPVFTNPIMQHCTGTLGSHVLFLLCLMQACESRRMSSCIFQEFSGCGHPCQCKDAQRPGFPYRRTLEYLFCDRVHASQTGAVTPTLPTTCLKNRLKACRNHSADWTSKLNFLCGEASKGSVRRFLCTKKHLDTAIPCKAP